MKEMSPIQHNMRVIQEVKQLI